MSHWEEIITGEWREIIPMFNRHGINYRLSALHMIDNNDRRSSFHSWLRINFQYPTIEYDIEWITRIAIPISLWGMSWWNQITTTDIIPELYGLGLIEDWIWRYYHNCRNLTNQLTDRIMKIASQRWSPLEGNLWSIYNRMRDNFPWSLKCRWINGRGRNRVRKENGELRYEWWSSIIIAPQSINGRWRINWGNNKFHKI